MAFFNPFRRNQYGNQNPSHFYNPQQMNHRPQMPWQNAGVRPPMQYPMQQMPGRWQQQPMPPQIPQQQMPQQAVPQQQPPQISMPPAQQAASSQPRQGQGGNFDNLKNIGTFMGYPEYTLPDVEKAEAPSPAPSVASMPSMPAMPAEANTPAVNQPPNSNLLDMYNGLKELVQSENNAAVFYGSLARLSPSDRDRMQLDSISERSKNRSDRLKDLHNTLFKDNFTPENRELEKAPGFYEGLRLAIREESISLRDYAQFAEKAVDNNLRDRLYGITIEKLCQINELNLLKND